MAALMEARFETYKQAVVQPFFTQLARGVDRQIVLVDVLRTLNAGPAAFADQRLAFETVLARFVSAGEASFGSCSARASIASSLPRPKPTTCRPCSVTISKR